MIEEKNIINQCMNAIPSATVAGLIDLENYSFINVEVKVGEKESVASTVVEMAKNLFKFDVLTSVENIFREANSLQNELQSSEELLVTADQLYYFLRLKAENLLWVVACPLGESYGVLISRARRIVAQTKAI